MLANGTAFQFHQADVRQVEIEETDLLFVDAGLLEEPMPGELRRHGDKTRRFIVFHDTTTFGEFDEGAGQRGLWPAVEEFLTQGTFRLKQRCEKNNGLTVLERCGTVPDAADRVA